MTASRNNETISPENLDQKDKYYKDLLKQTLYRLLVLYLVPVILLVVFFQFEYHNLLLESRRAHVKSIAEYQAYTLDLFLRERVTNLANLMDDPKFPVLLSDNEMEEHLSTLKSTSDAFVDLGFFDSDGSLLSYAGPFPFLESQNYASEDWFIQLLEQDERYIITDIYTGFRDKPHFTIAVSRLFGDKKLILRAVISPEKIHEYMTTIEGSSDVNISILNKDGLHQVEFSGFGAVLEQSLIQPPKEPWLGTENHSLDNQRITYGYAWLKMTPWVLIVQETDKRTRHIFGSLQGNIILFVIAILIIEFIVITYRARSSVRRQRKADETEAELSGQLVQAAKLASVGELSAGIAHEINNPLAIITENVGLVKDLLDPEFSETISQEELMPHLDEIHNAAFRCRDITRKLLGFVRQTEVKLDKHNIHEILDNVVDGLLGSEFELSDINIDKNYCLNMKKIVTDRNQLEQVFLNLAKNAFDAMEGTGTFTIHTEKDDEGITVSMSDSGCGVTPEQLEKIFMPFFTTKEVGKGTGLGLSVSYGIVKSLGGDIYVDSKVGKGTIFTIKLPFTPEG